VSSSFCLASDTNLRFSVPAQPCQDGTLAEAARSLSGIPVELLDIILHFDLELGDNQLLGSYQDLPVTDNNNRRIS
jgi:hypothetical protein